MLCVSDFLDFCPPLTILPDDPMGDGEYRPCYGRTAAWYCRPPDSSAPFGYWGSLTTVGEENFFPLSLLGSLVGVVIKLI